MIMLACALLALGLFMYVFAPAHHLLAGRNKSRLEYLRERKDAIYENLRDLNFEYKAGKFPEADFISARESLEGEALVVVAEMESLQTKASSGAQH